MFTYSAQMHFFPLYTPSSLPSGELSTLYSFLLNRTIFLPVPHVDASFLSFKAGLSYLDRLSHINLLSLSPLFEIILFIYNLLFSLEYKLKRRILGYLVCRFHQQLKTAEKYSLVSHILESGIGIVHLYPLKTFFIILELLISLVGWQLE